MRRFALLALAAGTVFAGNAFAASSPISGSFEVRANVPGSCVLVSDTAIDFGDYDPVDVNRTTADTANGNIVLRCTKNTAYRVSLDEGLNKAAASTCTAPARRMTDGTEFINYTIMGSNNAAWGCTANTSDRGFTAASSNTDITLVTYGAASAGQDVGVGVYTDTVTYTVTF